MGKNRDRDGDGVLEMGRRKEGRKARMDGARGEEVGVCKADGVTTHAYIHTYIGVIDRSDRKEGRNVVRARGGRMGCLV